MMLLIWDSESLSFYLLPKGHSKRKAAWESNGLFINSDDTEGTAVEEINEWLDTDDAKSLMIKMPYKGEIKYVTHCGFIP